MRRITTPYETPSTAYDPVALAKKLEKHPVLEFRRLAAHLYKKNARWETSITLSKEDKLFQDAIITAAVSNSTEVVEDLLTSSSSGTGNASLPYSMLASTYYDLILSWTSHGNMA